MMRMILPLSAAIFAISVGTALAQSAAPATPLAPPAGNAPAGRTAYLANGCFQCHGTIGQGAPDRFGPRLAPKPVPYGYFHHQVRNPHNPIQTYTPMPVYTAKVLTEQQVADIYAYLVSIPPAKKVQDIPLLRDIKE